jgi:hypothetical protein
MSRLIDDIRGGALMMPWFVAPGLMTSWDDYCARVCDQLRKEVPVVLIDNVAQFYFSSEQEYWSVEKDFPNVAPPYPQFWCEHKMPKRIHSGEKGDTDLTELVASGRIGVLVTAIPPESAKYSGEMPATTKWILWCEVFIDYGQRGIAAQGPHGSIFMLVDEHGAILDKPWMQAYDGGKYTGVMRNLMTFTHPTLLAITFLHCRNVTVVDNPVPPKLARRYRERHEGRAPAAHKTLIIEPLKSVLRKEGRSGEVGIQKAMHICRGHFKDYREGRGLFGKYHQLVWQPMLVRGTKGETPPPREIKVKV